jgi:hypothetical protein
VNRWDFYNPANPAQPCPSGEVPRVDQGYIWGAAQWKNLIFFGTVANANCIGEAPFTNPNNPNGPPPYQTSSWGCDFGSSPYTINFWASPLALPPVIGDFRPSRYYVYNLTNHTIKDITPKLGGSPGSYCSATGGGTPLCLDNLWLKIRGVRTSTVYNDPNGHTYVLVSGPALVLTQGLSFFALDVTGMTDPSQFTNSNWVAEFSDPNYVDMRHWLSYQGVLYAPSAKQNQGGGAILQYTGNFANIPTIVPGPGNKYRAIPTCGSASETIPPSGTFVCFAFQNIGNTPDGIDTDAVIHTEINPQTGQSDPRIVVATWPPPGVAGLYMSPSIPPGGFGQPNPNPANWTKIWDYNLNYDPDPVVAATVGTGAIADFNGQLYWGTMVYAVAGTVAWLKHYDSNDVMSPQQVLASVTNTFRSTTLFRGTNFLSGTPTIQNLYGQAQFLVWNGPPGSAQGQWVPTNSNMGGAPALYGVSGFGNPYNNYTWTMAQFNGKLYVGTMDGGYADADVAPLILTAQGQPLPVYYNKIFPYQTFGADIYSFKDNNSPAVPETINGMGNYLNYGVRALIPNGTTSLLIGTANPMNLNSGNPLGGWQLIEAMPGSVNKGR